MTQAIFLSYASQDADAARRICEALRAVGLEVWFDQSELRGGDAWDASIRKQIKECALFVPIISATTNGRSEGYFRLEWKLAVDRSHLMADDQAFFLPVVIDDTPESSARVPDKFRERQWSRLRNDTTTTAFAQRVVRILQDDAAPPAVAPRAMVPASTNANVSIADTPKHVDDGFWLAVLPFRHRGGSDELAALAEGLAEDIVAGLLRFSYLRVMTRGAAASHGSENQDVREIGRELGARYVLEGSLRQAGTTLRVSLQLIDAGSGAHLWAENYDRPFKAEDMFSLQDELVPKIVSTVADAHGILPHSMSEAVRGKSPEQLTPYEAVLRSFGYGYRMSREEHAVVRAGLEHAVDVAPAYADAWAMLALVYLEEYSLDFNARPDPLGRALLAARRAADIAPSNALVNNALARTHFFRKEKSAFRVAADRALALNPFNGPTLAGLGSLIAYSGDWATGCAIIERALTLNPRHPGSYWMALVVNAYRQYDYAGALRLAMNINLPEFFGTHEAFAAIYGQLGDHAAAGRAVQELLRIRPDWYAMGRRRLEIFIAPELVEHFMEGLRKAGMDISDVASAPLSAGVPDNRPAIAVLPFTNMSANPEDEFFADGLAEELLNVMARIRGLRVAARTSSFSFKGKDADIPTIAAKLNVATVLEGSVRKVGKRIRVTAQLISAADGYHLWSETYDRELDDIFAVQDEIAQSVVTKLRATLMGEKIAEKGNVVAEVAGAAKGRSENVEAQQLYMQGRHLLNRKSAEDLLRSITYFQEAVALDPGFGLAWALLARAHHDAGGWGLAPMREANQHALVAMERALALASDLVDVQLSHAAIQLSYEFNWEGAQASLKRALELGPDDAEALTEASRLQFFLGNFGESITLGRRAVERDPLNAFSHRSLAMTLYATGDLQDAVRLLRKAIEISPDAIATRHLLAIVLGLQGHHEEALAEASLERAEWARLTATSLVKWLMNEPAQSNHLLAELEEKHGQDSAVQIAYLHAMRGNADPAFAWLERAYLQRDAGLVLIKAMRFFEPVRDDPRWPLFLKKMGFPV